MCLEAIRDVDVGKLFFSFLFFFTYAACHEMDLLLECPLRVRASDKSG